LSDGPGLRRLAGQGVQFDTTTNAAGDIVVVDPETARRPVGCDAHWWWFNLTFGYYYPITVTAHNEGSISPNTGTVAVSLVEGCPSYADSVVWDVPLRATGSTSLIVNP